MRIHLFFLLAALLVTRGTAQVFTTFTPDNSLLPSLLIHTSYTAPDGTLWFGLEDGLVQIDTQGIWSLYNTSNSGLPDNSVRSVTTGPDGSLWVGTFLGGLAHKVGDDWEVFNPENSLIPDDFVRCLAFDAQDSLWIGTSAGLVRWDLAEDWTIYTILNSGLLSNNITDLYIDNSDDVFMGTINGGLSIYSNGNIVYYRTENSFIADNTVSAVTTDALFSNIWMATAFGGLCVRTPDGTFITFNPFNSDIPDVEIDDLLIDSSGVCWLAMASTGLVRFDGVSWDSWNTENSSIPTNHIKTIAVDHQQRLWMGTEDAGLILFDPLAVQLNNEEVIGLEVYPNPAQDVLQILMPVSGNYRCALLNQQGVPVVETFVAGNRLKISVETLPAGVYLLKIFDPNHQPLAARWVTVHHGN